MKRSFFLLIVAIFATLPLRGQTITTTVLDVGTGGVTGQFTSQAIVNGNPAIAYYNASEANLMFARNSASDGAGAWTVVTVDGLTSSVGQYASMSVADGNPVIGYYDSTNQDLKFVRALDPNGTSWGTPVTVDSIGSVGTFVSLAMVNGKPSISYHDSTNQDLKFVRALDAGGTGWATAITVDSSIGLVGQYTSLAVVNGNPAISYYDSNNSHAKYARALDPDGTTWGTPLTIPSSGSVGSFTSLVVVNGSPAIAFYNATSNSISYARSLDANGTDWGGGLSHVANLSTGSGQYISLAVVNGQPAVTCYNSQLAFVRALDANGTSWGTPLQLDVGIPSGSYSSMVVVAGNPAVSYYDLANGNLRYIRATDSNGVSWPAGTLADSGFQSGLVGQYTSQAVVNGNPAVSYYDATNLDLKYVRALDAGGTNWGSPVIVDSIGNVGNFTSLMTINGNPAIAYYDVTNLDLKYVRAMDANGTIWGTPVTVDGATGIMGAYASLAVVNGNPAISYENSTASDLRYIRATDANGASWGTPVTVDSVGSVGGHTSLAVVNGNPAISYFDGTNGDLRYVRALDASGTTWGAVLVPDSTGTVGLNTSMAVVNGNPAISYYDLTNADLKYVRAMDASGTSWGAPLTLDSAASVGINPSLALINGKPAISYHDSFRGDLKYVRALDASGAIWGTLIILDSPSTVGTFSSLAAVNGKAAISYYDSTDGNLKWATFAPPLLDISVTQVSSLSDNNSSVAFSTAVLGSPAQTLTFTIINTGGSDLTGLAVTKNGTDPGNLTVGVSGMATTLSADSSTTFTLLFTPNVSGALNAGIHIASNVIGSKNPFDFTATGQALTYAQDTDGDGLNDAAEFQMASLGFNWQVAQTALVNTYYSNAGGAGLFTQTQYDANRAAGRNDVTGSPNSFNLYSLAQVQTLNAGVPLLTKEAGTGKFKLTIGIQKAAAPSTSFAAFPLTAPDTTINAQGKLEFLFTVPDNAAFFRVQAQ